MAKLVRGKGGGGRGGKVLQVSLACSSLRASGAEKKKQQGRCNKRGEVGRTCTFFHYA